jgi:hypothetical protein
MLTVSDLRLAMPLNNGSILIACRDPETMTATPGNSGAQGK